MIQIFYYNFKKNLINIKVLTICLSNHNHIIKLHIKVIINYFIFNYIMINLLLIFLKVNLL